MATECGNRVGKGVVVYPCTLAADHEGPCVANELPASKRERDRWTKDQVARPAAFPAEFKEDPTRVDLTRVDPASVGGGVVGLPVQAPPHSDTPPVPDFAIDVVDTMAGRVVCPTCNGMGLIPTKGVWAAISPTGKCPMCAGEGHVAAPEAPEEPEVALSEPEAAPEAPEPSRTRPGDQPLPTIHEGEPNVQDALIADIEARKAVGMERYGTPLQVFNGRDSLLDVYEEALDLTTYLKQVMLERAEAVRALNTLENRIHEQMVDEPWPPEVWQAIITLRVVLGY